MSFQQAEITSILGDAFGNDANGKPVDPATRVDEHFRALHDFVVGGKDHPAQLDTVIAKIQQVYQGLNQAANAPNQGQALLGMVAGSGAAGARRRAAVAGPRAERAQADRGDAADRLAEQFAGDGDRRRHAARRRLALKSAAAVPGRVQPLPVHRRQQPGRAARRFRPPARPGRADGPVLRAVPASPSSTPRSCPGSGRPAATSSSACRRRRWSSSSAPTRSSRRCSRPAGSRSR